MSPSNENQRLALVFFRLNPNKFLDGVSKIHALSGV